MPTALTELQQKALTDFIDSLAKKTWNGLSKNEQEPFCLAGLTETRWDLASVDDRKALIAEVRQNLITSIQSKPFVDDLVDNTTDDELRALNLKKDFWDTLTKEQRVAFVRFMLMSEALTAPEDKPERRELPAQRQWKLPLPDNKVLPGKK